MSYLVEFNFEMLTCVMKFKDVFPRFAERDSHNKYLPSDEDWRKVEAICQLLEVFNSATSMVSGSDYPTSNLYLSEVYIIKEFLNSKQFDSDYFIRDMVESMKQKFDKCWGEVNLLMVLASILDPRGKLMFVKFVFNKLHSTNEATIKLEEVKNSLYEVFY